MRVLFILKQLGYIRHFTSVIAALADRGHIVRVAHTGRRDGREELPAGLQGRASVSVTTCASKRGDEWQEYASLVRRSADYLRYLTPPFAGARKLRARAFEKLVRTASNGQRAAQPGWSDIGLGLTEAERDRFRGLLSLVQRMIPPDAALEEWVRQEAPDLVLITPLVDIGSGQADYVKVCRSLGIPIAMVLFSWDNLSTKGLIHELPDRIFVWNDLQAKEAVELHDVPAKTITVTGAPRFDDFFALKPSLDRQAFCGALGLEAGEPIVMYLESSKFVAEREEVFISRWIEALRATAGLERINVLIKSHPDLNRAWGRDGERLKWPPPSGAMGLRVSRPLPFERVVVARTPFSGAQFLYDALFHSAVVVGLNTSAELEAGIVGRPVLTIRVPEELADGQESTLHFHYLLKDNGGFVETARDLAEHCAQLGRAVAGDVDRERIERFITSFLRPAGIGGPATDILVRSVERMLKRVAKQRPRPEAIDTGGRAAHEAPRGKAEPATAEAAVSKRTGVEAPAGARAAVVEEPPQPAEPSDVIDLDYPGVPIRLRATSGPERQWRARTCRKEPWTVEWIERVVGPSAVLYDIGANVGAFTLIAARRQPAATVVAFEPGYASYAHLCDNLVLNHCQANVIPIPLPLWSRTTLAALKYRSLEPGQSRHGLRDRPPAPHPSASADGRYEQPVLAVRLDDLVRQYGLPQPTAMKLDVDGAELEVLKGACETLRSPRLDTLLVEYAPDLEADVVGLLGSAGFERVASVDRTKTAAPGYGEFSRTAR